MANARAMKAPDAAFSLGDDEDDSLGEVDGSTHSDIRLKGQSGSNHAGGIPASSASAPPDGPRVADKPLPISSNAAASMHTLEPSGGEGKPQLNGKHNPPMHVSPSPAAVSGAEPASEQATVAPASGGAVPPSELAPGASSGPGPGVSKEGEEEEEQRIAQELAALEAEAEALALQGAAAERSVGRGRKGGSGGRPPCHAGRRPAC